MGHGRRWLVLGWLLAAIAAPGTAARAQEATPHARGGQDGGNFEQDHPELRERPDHLGALPGESYASSASGPRLGRPAPAFDSPWLDEGSYTGLLVLGYLLALPAAGMTGGVGVFLPAGIHYWRDNDSRGNHAMLGIAGGALLGAAVGGLVDQPQGGFRFTRGMAIGALSGFYLWGLLDVLFFSGVEGPDRRRTAVELRMDPSRGELGLAARLKL